MSFDHRKACREWLRKKRAADLAKRRQTAERCPARLGPHGICGDVLIHEIDRFGRVTIRCDRCERRLAGICRDCPNPVAGQVRKAVRCAPCRKRAEREFNRVYRERHREELRERDAAHQRRYRAANPWKGRFYAKRYREAHREECRARQRAWRQAHREAQRRLQRRAYRKAKRLGKAWAHPKSRRAFAEAA